MAQAFGSASGIRGPNEVEEFFARKRMEQMQAKEDQQKPGKVRPPSEPKVKAY